LASLFFARLNYMKTNMDTRTVSAAEADEVWFTPDLAEFLRVSVPCVNSWVNQGIAPPFSRAGNQRGRRFWLRSRVLQWLHENEVEQRASRPIFRASDADHVSTLNVRRCTTAKGGRSDA
jgi:phage terminase Nu1 subunit (DNA packaging protein)